MTSTRAREYAVDLDSLHSYFHEEMANAQICYQGLADAKCTLAPDFKVGDQAYVKAKYFRSTWPSKKLSEKNLGPYTIITQVGSLSFTLCLPDSMCAVHLVFHVSQLEPEDMEQSHQWVATHSCNTWQNGIFVVDGLMINLFAKPSIYGKMFYNRKSRLLVELSGKFKYLFVCMLLMHSSW